MKSLAYFSIVRTTWLVVPKGRVVVGFDYLISADWCAPFINGEITKKCCKAFTVWIMKSWEGIDLVYACTVLRWFAFGLSHHAHMQLGLALVHGFEWRSVSGLPFFSLPIWDGYLTYNKCEFQAPTRMLAKHTQNPNKEDQSIPWCGGTQEHPTTDKALSSFCIKIIWIPRILNSNTTRFYPFLKRSCNHRIDTSHREIIYHLPFKPQKYNPLSKMTRSTLSKKPPRKKDMNKITTVTYSWLQLRYCHYTHFKLFLSQKETPFFGLW